jgi:integrase
VQGTASELAHFGRFLARHDPGLASLALLDRQRHIEPYLTEVAVAVNHRTGQPIAASTAKARIQSVGSFLDAIAEWGWPEAPARRLIFPRDAPKLPHPLPRYLPPDQERALLRALEDSPNRLYADALLLLRATGMRIGELTDLELDCVHEVPGSGAWLKIPLGKLLTERMVPIDEETVELVDRIVARRSPGRPLRHPRTGQLADFLLTHQGRRVSAYTLRDELHRAAAEAGLDGVVPHQLRHTYATALEGRGVASDATFREKREDTRPALQLPRCSLRAGRVRQQSGDDLRCHHPVASTQTMLQPLLLHPMTRMMRQTQRKAQRRGGMPLPPAHKAQVFGRVGNPLPTSFNRDGPSMSSRRSWTTRLRK